MARIQHGLEARERVLSGAHTKPPVTTAYQSSRAQALQQHEAEQDSLRADALRLTGPAVVRQRLQQMATPPAGAVRSTPAPRSATPKNPVLQKLQTVPKKLGLDKLMGTLGFNDGDPFSTAVVGMARDVVDPTAPKAVDDFARGALSDATLGTSKSIEKLIRGREAEKHYQTPAAKLGAPVGGGLSMLLPFGPAAKAGSIGKAALGGAGVGAAMGAISGANGEISRGVDRGAMAALTDVAANIGINAAAGGALGAVAGGVAGALGRLLARRGVAKTEAERILALPEASDSLKRRSGNAVEPTPSNGSPSVVYGHGEVTPLGLPEPAIGAPTIARRKTQTANPYREQFETLIGRAQQLEREGKLTPGREDMDLASLWSQMAGRDAPSLDELIDLAYKPASTRRPAADSLAAARQNQYAREVAGAPLPVKSMADRYQGGAVAAADAPVNLVGRRLEVLRRSEATPTTPKMEPAASVKEAPAPRNDNAPLQPEWDGTIPFDTEDIALPASEEVAPRVRDRVAAYADDLIASARAELAKSKHRLSSNPADVYGQYAKIGAAYMLKGTVKLADFGEALVRDFGEEIRPHVHAIFTRSKAQYKVMRATIEAEELGLNGFGAQKLKDLSNINLNTGDVYRNFKKVFGEDFEPVKKAILDPFDAAKGEYAQMQKNLTDQLQSDIVQKLSIRKGSRDSALVQRYGERQISIDELKDLAPKTWKNVIRADAWFRQQYDTLIDQVNASVSRIYPDRPEKLVPKRADYYRHFQEMNAWSGLKNLFDTSSGKISPSLAGLSPFTQPKTKWASFKQKRGLGEFKNDAVGGFLEYIPAAAYAAHIDPHIAVFRNLAKRLAADTETTANINNFIKYLNNYANDLAGKTSPVDRWVEEVGGRKALLLLNKANNRVKSNVILGNVRSTLSQMANIPNGIAYGGIDAPAGALRTLESIWQPNEAMARSAFLRERYLDKSFRRFDQRWWEQPKRFAEWMMETSDRVGTTFVWNTAFAKGIRQKVADPVKFADENTRRLLGGRGVGEQPLLIKSKMFNLVAPFQLEVNNLWRVQKEFVDEKRFGALITLFAANWLLNKAFEKMTGSGVVFDPIDALVDASSEDMPALNRLGRVGGEVLSNLPFGQTLAGLYPEYGANLYGTELPTREEFFGDKDPTRFGSGLLAAGAVTDPLFKFVLPFGGNQIKKTIQGGDAIARGGVYTENVLTTGPEIEERKLKYPVERSLPNIGRALAFSPNATTEGQRYNHNDLRPLSEKQTRSYLRSADQTAHYEKVQRKRQLEAAKAKMKEIRQNKTLSQAEKDKRIAKIKNSIAD